MTVPFNRAWWVISEVLGNSSPRSQFKHDKLFLVPSGFPGFVLPLGSLVAIQYGCSSTLSNEKSQFGPKNGAETGESRMVLFLGPIQPH